MAKAADSRRVLFTGRRFHVVEIDRQTPDGRVVPHQAIMHPGAVVIVPVLPSGQVCLIRNERAAVGRTLVELPAGTIDPPEAPHETAARELTEETGYSAASWTELPGFFMSPGILCERMHVFVAEDLVEGRPAREPSENIDNLIVPFAQALTMIDRGEIEDAKTICALLMWDRREKQR